MQVNQRLQFMLLAVVGGLMGGISSGYLLHTGAVYAQPGTERAVVAKRFQLVGDDGQLRGFFSADADGTAILNLADKKGKPRIGLAVKPDGSPSVNVYGVNGIQQVTLGVAGNQAGLSVRTETSDRAFIGALPVVIQESKYLVETENVCGVHLEPRWNAVHFNTREDHHRIRDVGCDFGHQIRMPCAGRGVVSPPAQGQPCRLV